jgi:exodeoxyribonuclease V gamma subunit
LQIKQWIRDTQIKWGIDKNDKKKQNLPPFSQNTWRSGLEQLLLGYAMSGEELLQDILPYAQIETAQAKTLGNFIAFCEELFAFVEVLRTPRTLSSWTDVLQTALTNFFLSADLPGKEINLITAVLTQFKEKEELAGYHDNLELAVIRSLLKEELTSERMGYNFLSGGVTFCNLLPMRSIPYKVICLLGMNDKAFPRISQSPGFDLMAKSFRRGDRITALSDRYLFLETLLSARQRLYISYVGLNIQDNTEYPPSVVVCELLDTIRTGYLFADTETNRANELLTPAEKLVIKHRLQAFNPAYFSPAVYTGIDSTVPVEQGLFSFSEELYHASQTLLGTRHGPLPFLSGSQPPP